MPWCLLPFCPAHPPRLSPLGAAMLDLARLYGIAVCCTIHSPPPDTFALFHRVMLLQRGRLVYFGPNGVRVCV